MGWIVLQIVAFGGFVWAGIAGVLEQDGVFPPPEMLVMLVVMGVGVAAIATGAVYWTMELGRWARRRLLGEKKTGDDARPVIAARGEFLDAPHAVRTGQKKLGKLL